MGILRRLVCAPRNLVRGRRMDSELDRELRTYVEMLTEEKVAAGAAPERARREALIESGELEQVKEQVRAIRTGVLLEQFVQDVRYTLRGLRRAPAFTTTVIVMLALGIGANTAILSVIDALLLRPLPLTNPHQLAAVYRGPSGTESAFSYPDFAELTSRRTGQSRRTRWTSNLLVGTQMALAVMLVVSAVLLARTLANLHAVSTGFAVEQVASARISPPQFRFSDASARRDLYSQVLERAAGAPGVVSAAVTDRLPLGGEAYGSVFSIEGRPDPARTGEWPIADVSAIVSPAFFSTLGMPVQAGRTFTPDDSETSQRVAVISESLANKYWPGESPIGADSVFLAMAIASGRSWASLQTSSGSA